MKFFNNVLNKIEENRDSEKKIYIFIIKIKDMLYYVYILMCLCIFLLKKKDWNCDPFPFFTELDYYISGGFNLPNKPVILNSSQHGFFSNFIGVIGYFHFCEKNGYSPIIDFSNGCYFDINNGPNWYYYYFDNNYASKFYYNIEDYLDTESFSHYARSFLTLKQKNILFSKYIKIKENISKEVESTVKNNFKDYFIIGCQIRGTDKVSETKFVNSIDTFFKQIDKKIKNIDKYKIFLATDDVEYYSKFKDKYGHKLISLNNIRSSTDLSVHHNENNRGYEIGKQVLKDVLILSKCDYFIGSRSNVSHAVLIFNPDIDYKIIKK